MGCTDSKEVIYFPRQSGGRRTTSPHGSEAEDNDGANGGDGQGQGRGRRHHRRREREREQRDRERRRNSDRAASAAAADADADPDNDGGAAVAAASVNADVVAAPAPASARSEKTGAASAFARNSNSGEDDDDDGGDGANGGGNRAVEPPTPTKPPLPSSNSVRASSVTIRAVNAKGRPVNPRAIVQWPLRTSSMSVHGAAPSSSVMVRVQPRSPSQHTNNNSIDDSQHAPQHSSSHHPPHITPLNGHSKFDSHHAHALQIVVDSAKGAGDTAIVGIPTTASTMSAGGTHTSSPSASPEAGAMLVGIATSSSVVGGSTRNSQSMLIPCVGVVGSGTGVSTGTGIGSPKSPKSHRWASPLNLAAVLSPTSIGATTGTVTGGTTSHTTVGTTPSHASNGLASASTGARHDALISPAAASSSALELGSGHSTGGRRSARALPLRSPRTPNGTAVADANANASANGPSSAGVNPTTGLPSSDRGGPRSSERKHAPPVISPTAAQAASARESAVNAHHTPRSRSELDSAVHGLLSDLMAPVNLTFLTQAVVLHRGGPIDGVVLDSTPGAALPLRYELDIGTAQSGKSITIDETECIARLLTIGRGDWVRFDNERYQVFAVETAPLRGIVAYAKHFTKPASPVLVMFGLPKTYLIAMWDVIADSEHRNAVRNQILIRRANNKDSNGTTTAAATTAAANTSPAPGSVASRPVPAPSSGPASSSATSSAIAIGGGPEGLTVPLPMSSPSTTMELMSVSGRKSGPMDSPLIVPDSAVESATAMATTTTATTAPSITIDAASAELPHVPHVPVLVPSSPSHGASDAAVRHPYANPPLSGDDEPSISIAGNDLYGSGSLTASVTTGVLGGIAVGGAGGPDAWAHGGNNSVTGCSILLALSAGHMCPCLNGIRNVAVEAVVEKWRTRC